MVGVLMGQWDFPNLLLQQARFSIGLEKGTQSTPSRSLAHGQPCGTTPRFGKFLELDDSLTHPTGSSLTSNFPKSILTCLAYHA